MKPCSPLPHVICLLTALSGSHGSPSIKVSRSRHPEDADLGNAIRSSIQDAIRGAVAKVVSHEAQPAEERVVRDSLHSHKEIKENMDLLSKRSSLRGRAAKHKDQQNPWRPDKPLRVLDHALQPVAPMDRLTPGVKSQGGFILPPGYYPRVVYYPKAEDKPNPFPQRYYPKPPEPAENHFMCYTAPDEWADAKGRNCDYYQQAQLCTPDGKPDVGWQSNWGTFESVAVNEVSGIRIGAAQACCACGGGARVSVVGRAGERELTKKRLIAPADRVPDPKARWFEKDEFAVERPERPRRQVQASEDVVPMPYRQVAPADKVSMKYSRYFNDIWEQSHKHDPRGFSVRFYSEPPKMCEAALPQAVASRIDRVLEYSGSNAAMSLVATKPGDYDPVYPEMHRLAFPGKATPASGVWWAKWSGTMQILEPGNYTFNLDVGFNTVSELRVDGIPVLTEGQCAISKNQKTCEAKNCYWEKPMAKCVARGIPDNQTNFAEITCGKGQYRSSPVLFSCNPDSGVVDSTLGPSGTTSVMTIPQGVTEFELSATAQANFGLQIFEPSTQTWLLNFGQGIVNNQQPTGTYHGQYISFSGYVGRTQSFTLSGMTPTELEVSIVNYDPNPTSVQLQYLTHGLQPCPGPNAVAGCSALNASEATEMVQSWSDALVQRYQDCHHAWTAVTHDYPGGDVTWSQWASVYPMAWGQQAQRAAEGPSDPAHPAAWQKTFAILDNNNDGHITEDEFFNFCHQGGAPSPGSPSTAPNPPQQYGSKELNHCVHVKVRDRSQWPPNPFAGTGYHDSSLLNSLFGIETAIQEQRPSGVLLASPHGEGPNDPWFYPAGTYDCVRWTKSGPSPAVAPNAPAPSSLAPAPSPSLVQVSAASAPNAILNSMTLTQGGHCVEAIVMMTSGAQSLALKYAGADTQNQEVIVPGLLVHCDPIVKSCTNQAEDECAKYREECAR